MFEGIDHIVIAVEDLDAAVAQYEATNVEIERIESSDAARAETAETIGQQISAMSSVLITLIVITILVLVETY